MKLHSEYLYHSSTLSFCNECKKQVASNIVFKDSKVYIIKECQEHNETISLLEEDMDYYLRRKDFDKPSTTSSVQTKVQNGCPHDCGLCPDHDQHTCIGLIEITNLCNLKCPLCYASSGKGDFLDMKKIDEMMDFYIESENGSAEILQISGGEPTLHPQIFEILCLAKKKNFKYVMLNTNGIRIAADESFAKRLAEIFDEGKFEVYLQFDGFKPSTYKCLRADSHLLEIKLNAISNLKKYEVPITLVATIEKGVNDDEVGDIVKFALKEDYIRGVNFQPVTYFGRLNQNTINHEDRITMTGVLKCIESQTSNYIKISDFIPLPCNVERVAITYLFREKDAFVPITRKIDFGKYLDYVDNTFVYDADDFLKKKEKIENDESSTQIGNVCSCMSFMNDLKPIIPWKLALKSKKERIRYVNENLFRISVSSFIDIYNFDLESMKKECVHFITPDLKRIPFSSYNMFHGKDYR